mmetsp:Transcript_87801/g.244474  ORF Transcript_87801/g.244474 Transcript_87801/m.244474 type:complete len:202 (-) Transcript_87801:68-673(-)
MCCASTAIVPCLRPLRVWVAARLHPAPPLRRLAFTVALPTAPACRVLTPTSRRCRRLRRRSSPLHPPGSTCRQARTHHRWSLRRGWTRRAAACQTARVEAGRKVPRPPQAWRRGRSASSSLRPTQVSARAQALVCTCKPRAAQAWTSRVAAAATLLAAPAQRARLRRAHPPASRSCRPCSAAQRRRSSECRAAEAGGLFLR